MSVEVKQTSGGKDFLALTLGDATGEMTGRVWDNIPDDYPAAGELARCVGFVDEFNGPQMKLTAFESTDHVLSNEFIPSSEQTVGNLAEEFWGTVDVLSEPYKGIVTEIAFGRFETFAAVPAAQKNHHAFMHGLLEHTVSMIFLAKLVVGHYSVMYRRHPIDRDLVLAGIILHDFAKLFDVERVGLTWEPTLHSELVGHIPQITMMIHDACCALLVDDDVRARLHVVLAHHGRTEWGSPVEPKTVEAQIVHQIDMMDSKLAMFRQATRGLERGEVSEWIRPLRRRVVR
jgi:3'-5' exoribonuclease